MDNYTGEFVGSQRLLAADPKYGSPLVAKFINCLMFDGKKSVASRVFYDAMDIIASRVSGEEPVSVFYAAIENVKPHIEVRSKRVGGATYQVPTPVNAKRRQSLSIRWLLDAARTKKGRSMSQKLADELIAAYRREGTAVTKRENVHRMADANKAFSHFA